MGLLLGALFCSLIHAFIHTVLITAAPYLLNSRESRSSHFLHLSPNQAVLKPGPRVPCVEDGTVAYPVPSRPWHLPCPQPPYVTHQQGLLFPGRHGCSLAPSPCPAVLAVFISCLKQCYSPVTCPHTHSSPFDLHRPSSAILLTLRQPGSAEMSHCICVILD